MNIFIKFRGLQRELVCRVHPSQPWHWRAAHQGGLGLDGRDVVKSFAPMLPAETWSRALLPRCHRTAGPPSSEPEVSYAAHVRYEGSAARVQKSEARMLCQQTPRRHPPLHGLEMWRTASPGRRYGLVGIGSSTVVLYVISLEPPSPLRPRAQG